MPDIAHSNAYDNGFFRQSYAAEHANLACLIREWFPVTQAFCLAVPGYAALFTSEILKSREDKREILENAILAPLMIGCGEFGMGGGGVDGIHYRMFARLGEPFGLALADLRRTPRGTLRETGRLVDGIKESLCNLYRGAGCLLVVESTAYNIVSAMHRLFAPLKQKDGSSLFTAHQLEYITLHLELEQQHARIAASFVEVLCDAPEVREMVDTEIERICALFGDYWDALAKIVFSEIRVQKITTC